MRRTLIALVGTLAALAAWAWISFEIYESGWLRDPIAESSRPADFAVAAKAMIDRESRGDVVFMLIEDGTVVATEARSKGKPVDANSMFQVASLSKWLSSWGVMALVQDGALDLDKPVSTYLTRWKLPESPWNDEVTARRLLSHTAGLDDGLGYAGFEREDEVQSPEDSLTKARDASPGANPSVRVAEKPGTSWNYSGGGYTLLQLLVEEVSGKPFDTYMKERVFRPLGMTDTTYVLDDAARARLAPNFDAKGRQKPLLYYSSLAATSAYTSANDLVRFVKAQVPGAKGGGVLTPATLEQMREPHAQSLGADIWGLGPMLFAANGKGGFIIGHDGDNEPAINTAVRLDPATGDGVIVLETGTPLLATTLGSEWVFWKTGNVDTLLFTLELDTFLNWLAIGALVIVVLGIVLGWRFVRAGRR